MDFFQGRGSALALLGFLVAVQCMSASAVTWDVGDSAGWTFTNYTQWVQGKTFRVNDVLFFRYNKSEHNVLVVSKADYNSCTTSSPIFTYSQDNSSITLNATGNKYYICGFPGHCSGGMKLAIDVKSAAAPTPSPSRSPTPSPTPSVKSPTPSPASPSSPTPSAKSPTPSRASPSSPTPSTKSPTPSLATPSAPTPTTIAPGTPSPGIPSSPSTPAAPGPTNSTSGAPACLQVAGALVAVGSALVGYSVLFW